MSRFVVPYLIYSIAALVCIFLQEEVFGYLEIFHAKPDLLLLLVAMSALKTDWKNGAAVGLLLGFWIDLINAAYFGTNMVVYATVGTALGALGTRFPHRTYEGYFFTVVGATLFSGFMMLMVLTMIGDPLPVSATIGGIILPMTFYNALIIFFCMPLIWFHRHNNRKKIGRIDLLGNGVIFVRGNEKVDLEKAAAKRRNRKKQSIRKPQFRGKQEKPKSRGFSGIFGGKNQGQNRRDSSSRSAGSSKKTYGKGDRDRSLRNTAKRDSRGSSSDRRPRSHPQRRPQKHSGRRSK